MEKKNNKSFIILVIIFVMVAAIVGLLIWGLGDKINRTNLPFKTQIEENSMLTGNKYVTEEVKGLRVNTSEKLKEAKNMNGIEIRITQLTSLNNYTTILGTLKNTTNEQIVATDIMLTIYDDKGNELAKKNIGQVIPTLDANQEFDLNISIIDDYANAYDFKFERVVD